MPMFFFIKVGNGGGEWSREGGGERKPADEKLAFSKLIKTLGDAFILDTGKL